MLTLGGAAKTNKIQLTDVLGGISILQLSQAIAVPLKSWRVSCVTASEESDPFLEHRAR